MHARSFCLPFVWTNHNPWTHFVHPQFQYCIVLYCIVGLSPLPAAPFLPHLCVGLALHGRTCPILSPGTLLLHCYYSASYLITLFCPGGVAGPPNADCYPTAQSLLCGWSDGLEWSTGCAESDASSPLGSFSL